MTSVPNSPMAAMDLNSAASATTSATPMPPSDEFSNLSWERVTVINGKAIGCYGKKWAEFTVEKLCKICSKLSIRGVKNVKKDVIIEAFVTPYHNQGNYQDLWKSSKPNESDIDAPQKEVQCPFRLLNILFLDDFASDFAKIGNVASRATLDSGKAGNNEYFWVAVQSAFVNPDNDAYDDLNFVQDEDIFMDNDHIDPSKIVQHDWKALQKMWKAINAEYKAATTRFTISGKHDSNFYSFCNGHLDVFYLQKYLEMKPKLSGMVLSNLPYDVFVSTDMSTPELARKLFSKSATSSMTDSNFDRKRKRSEKADIASALRELGSNPLDSELAKHRISLLVKAESLKEEQNERLKEKDLFEKYETLQKNIRLLQQDLKDPALDDATKDDINRDLKGLIKKKNEIATKIGIEQ